jgi:hypothetical protein
MNFSGGRCRQIRRQLSPAVSNCCEAANLWDDPFEWTLPETLATRERILEYLSEVEATRKRGFDLLKSDADLMKKIMSPSGETQLMPLLLETLGRAAQYLGRARATLDFIRSENQ